MAQYKFKKGQTIGALSAESDELLSSVFIDRGIVERLTNTSDPVFLVRGRTGTGKTALLRYVSECYATVSNLDPDELSMQYLHGNMMINYLLSIGIHLDIFFKYLWRHICIVELIKLRFEKKDDKSSIIDKLKSYFAISKNKTQELALEYLEKHGTDYWVTADTHIKAFTGSLETKLKQDTVLEAKIGGKLFGTNGKIIRGNENSLREDIDIEVVKRTQEIVNDYQVAALNEVVKELCNNVFDDCKEKYFLVIDDLDKNWMPDDTIYLELLKSLLFTVKELNQKLKGVKILVALRSNIYFRIFKKTKQGEPQREKWNDVLVDLIWTKDELEEMIDKRLSAIFRGQYEKRSPSVAEIFPKSKKKREHNSWDYVLDRTFLRPRDLLDYFNLILAESNGALPFNWKHLELAEKVYSKRRLESLVDEWKTNYFGLPALFPFLGKMHNDFDYEELTEQEILDILTYAECDQCPWLFRLFQGYEKSSISLSDIKKELLMALFITGIIGLKNKVDHKTMFSFEGGNISHNFSIKELSSHKLVVHKMFRDALNSSS